MMTKNTSKSGLTVRERLCGVFHGTAVASISARRIRSGSEIFPTARAPDRNRLNSETKTPLEGELEEYAQDWNGVSHIRWSSRRSFDGCQAADTDGQQRRHGSGEVG
jgi:hypothetical protein